MPSSPSPSAKTETEQKSSLAAEQKAVSKKMVQEKMKADPKLKKKREKKTGPKISVPYPYLHLVVGLLGTAGLLVAIFVTRQKLVLLASQLEEKNSQLVALQESSLGQQSLTQQYNSVVSRQDEVLTAFPNEQSIIDFFKLFRQLVGEAKVETFDFQTDQPLSDGLGNSYIEFAAEISGSVTQLDAFLARFTEVPYLVSFSLIDFEQNGTGGASLIIKARLEVEPNFYLAQ